MKDISIVKQEQHMALVIAISILAILAAMGVVHFAAALTL